MKTISLKKVSAVAVASLGFGLLSVIPAQAAGAADTTLTATVTSAPAAAAGATPGIVGTAIVGNLNMDFSAADFDDTETVIATFTLTNPNGTAVTSDVAWTAVAAPFTNVTTSRTGAVFTLTAGDDDADGTGDPTIGTFSFTPKMAGTYTFASVTTGTLANNNLNELAVELFVAGTGVNIAASGTGTTSGGAVTGGVAKVLFGATARAAATTYNLTSSGVGIIQTVVDGTVATGLATVCDVDVPGIAGATDYTQGAAVTCATTTFATALATVASTVAGVQTLTWTAISASTGAPTVIGTATITWGAAPVLSAALSTAFLGVGDQATVTANVSGGVQSINTAKTVVTDAAATIEVITRNSAGASLLATQTITAVVTGPGTISISDTNDTNSQGRAVTGSAGDDLISVFGDGTAGTSTITISQGTTVIATKTVTFFGAVATLTAKQNHKIASTAGATLGIGTAAPSGADIANTPAVVITAKDALGNARPGLTIVALSSDATVMSSGITFAEVTATPGDYNVAVTSLANTSGKTATLTFRVLSGTTVLAASAPVTYTLGGSVATVALSLDKATYSSGAPAIATLTLKDSSGNAAFDGDHTTILDGALSTSLSVVKTLQFNATTNTTVSSLGGVSTVAFNAPGTASAAWEISGTTGAGPSVDKAKALKVTASVTDNSAALNTRIDSLNSKIVALTALIAKIMKSLKIK